ncbi:HNH endonuclease [Erythrobacter jejuensis]|uniref:HNH endonuclease n=2 Tax=Parerythrobacter jejuensis TaxID=795812 RepID=A0A845AQ74_9SPHN|nr:HNH endonuclease [Parerythrobacter jejuensis]MXP33406.1 HNH endonuclease [Parerythrobacter jejuensis]
MNLADDESHELAISLIESIEGDARALEFPRPEARRWSLDSEFTLNIVSKRAKHDNAEDRIRGLASEIIVPVMAAMAELNGYDTVGEVECDAEMEGAIRVSTIRRRERNPRNRLLAIRIHGTICKVCGEDHGRQFGFEDSLVEIHHSQPLSLSDEGRLYDPRTDLVPLCPTCHRAAHRRRPLPFTVEELQSMLSSTGDLF